MVDYVIHHVRLNALALRTNVAEIVNSATHGMGLVLAVSAGMMLTFQAMAQGDRWRTSGCLVFAATLVGVYAASTLSHLAQRRPWRQYFRMWDQGLIYLLISGTYTPFALTYLRDGWWWLLTGAMWTLAAYGFINKIAFQHRVDRISLWLYLLLGWLPILGAPWYGSYLPGGCMAWMLGGGVVYTLGAVFLMLDHKWPYFHGVWHLLVIAGSACHFLAVWMYVAC